MDDFTAPPAWCEDIVIGLTHTPSQLLSRHLSIWLQNGKAKPFNEIGVNCAGYSWSDADILSPAIAP